MASSAGEAAVGIGALALGAALALVGCAEFGSIVPSIGVEGGVTRRTAERSDGARASWDLWVRAGVAAQWSAPPRAFEREDDEAAELAIAPAFPCRIAAICAWEARARAQALVRARRMLEETR
jgi:hypothetical protein